jgi:hypothetical protein
MVQLSAIKCSCITILWVSLLSSAAITLCVFLNECLFLLWFISLSTQSENFRIHPRIFLHKKLSWIFILVEWIQIGQHPWYRGKWWTLCLFVISTCELSWVMEISSVPLHPGEFFFRNWWWLKPSRNSPLLYISKGKYHVQISPPLDPILSQFILIYVLSPISPRF